MNREDVTENERAFLIGLEKLTRETGIYISGCGCCGSPNLNNIDKTKIDEKDGYGFQDQGEVSWIDSKDTYIWNRHGESIVK